MQLQFLGQEDPLEEELATYPSILAWGIPWTEEPHGLQKVRHDWAHTSQSCLNIGHWRSSKASGWILRFSMTVTSARVSAYRRRWRVLTERQKTGKRKNILGSPHLPNASLILTHWLFSIHFRSWQRLHVDHRFFKQPKLLASPASLDKYTPHDTKIGRLWHGGEGV